MMTTLHSLTGTCKLHFRACHTPKRCVFPALGAIHNRVECIGNIDGEDGFIEADSGKVLASWRLNLDKDGEISVIRGIDILEFEADKLKKKMAYMKVDKPHLEST